MPSWWGGPSASRAKWARGRKAEFGTGKLKEHVLPKVALSMRHVPGILLIGVGAHSSKQALAPQEPALHSAGLSPMMYSLVTAVPAIGQIVTPVLWGGLQAYHPRVAVRLAPCGILLGQFLLTVGFAIGELDSGSWVDGAIRGHWITVVGIVVLGLTRAGVTIVQASMLARALSDSWVTRGFGLKVATTTVLGALCNWLVPIVLKSSGLFGVQCALLVPAGVGAIAGGYTSLLYPSTRTTQLLGSLLPSRFWRGASSTPPMSGDAPISALPRVVRRRLMPRVSPASLALISPRTLQLRRSAFASRPSRAKLSQLLPVPRRERGLPPLAYRLEGAVGGVDPKPLLAGVDEHTVQNGAASPDAAPRGGASEGYDVEAPRCATEPGGGSESDEEPSDEEPSLSDPGLRPLLMLAAWRAVTIGAFHSSKSLLVSMLVAGGIGVAEAGRLSASWQLLALLLLPFACYAADRFDRRVGILLATVAGLAAAIMFALSMAVGSRSLWEPSIFALIAVGEITPVLPLALIPSLVSARSVPRAYGICDALDMAAQIAITLLFGALRQLGSFPLVRIALCVLLAVGAAIAAVFASLERVEAGRGSSGTRAEPIEPFEAAARGQPRRGAGAAYVT